MPKLESGYTEAEDKLLDLGIPAKENAMLIGHAAGLPESSIVTAKAVAIGTIAALSAAGLVKS